MSKKTWAEVSATAAEIIDGKFDGELDYIQQACQARKKTMFRRGQLVSVSERAAGPIACQQATIIKVNPKTITIGVGRLEKKGSGDFTYEEWSGGEWNISPALLVTP